MFQYFFVDEENKYIFTTTDYGYSFQARKVDFKPKTVTFHRTDYNLALAVDYDNKVNLRCLFNLKAIFNGGGVLYLY